MMDSQRLLAEYVKNGSESAFRELVSRYVNFVYSTALRLVDGDAHLAEDVAQTVFIGLANNGRTLSTKVMLGGWLHQHTYHVATKAVRAARRRQSREREAVEMNALQNDFGANLRQFGPILDEALTQLGSEDRTAIVLRFFEQRDFRSVGEALGSNEDAARMRVSRALEKLHSLLKRRGVTFSAVVLGTALTAEAVTAAPAGLAVTVSSVALASATGGIGTIFAFLKFMAATKLKLGVGTLVIAGVTTVLIVQHHAQVKLREENQSLRQQIARLQSDDRNLSSRGATAKLMLHLPGPTMQVGIQPSPSPMEDLPSTNLFTRFKDGPPKLTTEQVDAYLKANGRKASSLLAAYRTSGDSSLLKEAMEKYPNDPQVAFEAVFDKDLPPEEQRQWLNTFKQSAPDNALANYLSAFNYFKAGQTDQGIEELTAASGKQQFQDYTLDRIQDDQEAYLSAGYSPAEAISIAFPWEQLPQLAPLKQLGQRLVDLANAYNQSGDQASAQAALQIAMNLGQRYTDVSASPTLIGPLVGAAIEKSALSTMDPDRLYGGTGQTVQDQLDQIAQQRAALQKLSQQVAPLLQTVSDQDVFVYENRKMIFGEAAAIQWLISKYGQQ